MEKFHVVVLNILVFLMVRVSNASNSTEKRSISNAQYVEFSKWSQNVSVSSKAALAASTAVISLSSIISNSIIIHSVRVNQNMHTTTNYFIVNMACADLVLTITNFPYNIHFAFKWFAWFPGWLGHITCGGYILLVYGIILCSIFSMIVITLDRFLAVSRPLKYRARHKSSKYILCLSWLVAIVIPMPLTYYGPKLITLENGQVYCVSQHEYVNAVVLIVAYVCPSIIIVILCLMIVYKLWKRKIPGEDDRESSRQKEAYRTSRRATYMILAVVGAFGVTWAPSFIVSYIAVLNRSHFITAYVWPVAFNFAYLNGSLNIVIYYIFSQNYRTAFKELWARFKTALC